ncbi:sedoheptulokinase [Ruthenibacterium lactatiformans]|uniref:Carbohydrate kinase FGGY N-terminal domain-containing protein n=1 Tax=Ruthenibacterium lactatiformans TaxID=1550024 RepID=A0A6L6LW88_9FIRM|nr:FGGY family carbohydrate kinase [Ruthenibacterium lactatiformans]EHL63785.1 hypothetical protein HMPREF1032_03701 [Subdoligranulum sp. 4_3_54A2FAA]MTQ82303.1 hypothetical protein [Ruthenibacterium lactatiformans]MTS21889.1 hypothetical protein [Ruthenibacterium lactatiformans]MTS29026.1 hypothetical protein [Ruthenibacterium lactatiformans]MTS32680.1 hypothetical protein [Ruthenibacterium lactatiformans]
MITIGVDIGTTTISAVAADEKEGVLKALTLDNNTFLGKCKPWESMQQPEKILDKAVSAVQMLLEHYPEACCIGVTGQQHGILYLDEKGIPVSPLYTWQDGRGNLPYKDKESYAAYLNEITGVQVAAGYGMVTHFYNLQNHLVPPGACTFCTIADYIAMRMAGLTQPVLDASNAASFGLFDLEKAAFNVTAAFMAGIPSDIFPEVAKKPCFLGQTMFNIPVAIAIGDNQASFLGAVGGHTDSALINVGTGSQFSAYSPILLYCEGLETRPFPTGGYLLVGASLCGGRAYALLEAFFRDTVKMVMGQEISCYAAMEKLLESNPLPTNLPIVCTAFEGTRENSEQRGSFTQLSTANMTPLHWIWGVMQGMTDELHEMYRSYLSTGAKRPMQLVGSGNGLRRNRFLCGTVSRTFGCKLELSPNKEEAAYGTALFVHHLAKQSL